MKPILWVGELVYGIVTLPLFLVAVFGCQFEWRWAQKLAWALYQGKMAFYR